MEQGERKQSQNKTKIEQMTKIKATKNTSETQVKQIMFARRRSG